MKLIELLGGPRDGEQLWYDSDVPKLVEYATEDLMVATGPGGARRRTPIRVHRYVRTAESRMTYWPAGRPFPGHNLGA